MTSSINLHPTIQYSQPEEYRFSHDSVFLARQVFELITQLAPHPSELEKWKVLDLCSGCGVVGIDLLFHIEKEAKKYFFSVDFLEVQEIYREYFEKNIAALSARTPTQLVLSNYELLGSADFANKYHLIVSNPPYFRVGQGALSPSDFKNRCRFFMDSTFEYFIRGICHALASGGRAYFLLRSLQDHGIDVFEETKDLLGQECSLEIIDDIRGTPLALIRKNV